MYRKAIVQLKEWKESKDRKPLILKGARQVGKTWLMKEFGELYYKNTVYLNFDEEEELKSIFQSNKNPRRIVELLCFLSGEKIERGTTLLIFDEVQECPEALNTLKYFQESANEYHVIAAGSLLGTLLAQPKSFPVGKVNVQQLYPLSFDEFLKSADEAVYQYYMTIEKRMTIEKIFHNRLLEYYDYYLIVGGMPECVSSWIEEKDPKKLTIIQKELLMIYENDFSKHNGKVNAGRILMVFRSIVTQLAKANEKFIYGCIREGARAREFEEAIEWLVSAGLFNRVYNVAKPEHPLRVFEILNHFKIYLFDTGLLKEMAGIDNKAILLQMNYQFKGALAENFVLQQIQETLDVECCYYAENANSEIDFIIQNGTDILPIEVKRGVDKEANSFKKYIARYKPEKAIRFSRREYREDGVIINLPLYLAPRIKEFL